MAGVFNYVSDVIVSGTADDDNIISYGNNDTIIGFGGDDTILSAGQEVLIYGDSLVTGGEDSGTGKDLIFGREGPDTIWGGASADTMTGGGSFTTSGIDTFSFGWVPQARLPTLDTTDFQGNNDLIIDFDQASGDTIDLNGYMLEPNTGVFLGTKPFTDENVLQVRYEDQGDTTAVQFKAPTSSNVATAQTGEIDLGGKAYVLTIADFAPGLEDRSGTGCSAPPTEEVDWNALAAQVLANFAATGHWFV
ncbi:calcium-binding protein [Belnapia sp. T18]|uniref:Calcium-binding protein n=1 Tax=Belnapia arida TaxID=2804533 RepID=A0ABS1U5T5_9PROT|nr:calcium-binding protein [Belnapia arida]MBL6080018.1 calcium-binding protein [Belnapia arida]